MSIVHWGPPNCLADVLHEMWRPHTAEPREVRVRPEVYARLLVQVSAACRAGIREHGTLGHPGIPLVVDGSIPKYPGYEVRRVCPKGALTCDNKGEPPG